MFYPGDARGLLRMVGDFLSTSGRSPDASVTGLVCPHAGYVYSGRTAGAAFASAPDQVRTVVIVAPCHRYPVRGASVYGGEAYLTPLGRMPVNREIADRLAAAGHRYEPRAHELEHAEEVQVPFVQVRWPGARIVPVVQGYSDGRSAAALASDLRAALADEEDVLLVASSDLSHYHDIETARLMDAGFQEAFESGDPARLERVLSSGSSEACGGGPVLTLLNWAALGGPFAAERIAYDTSATASGDSSAVVGYFAGCTRRTG